MYASLTTADGSFAAADGGTWFVQKDDRPAAEIAEDLEHSTLFALVRTLNPLRTARPERRARLQYVFAELPPEPVREAVASAGGHLLHVSAVVAHEGVCRAPEDLTESVLPVIARRVAATRSLEFSRAGLESLERALAPARDADEATYWRAVLDIGAYAGETLRKAVGGRWIRRDEAGVIPFAFACTIGGEPAELYLLGKATRLLDNGPVDSLTGYVEMAERAKPPASKSLWSKLFR